MVKKDLPAAPYFRIPLVGFISPADAPVPVSTRDIDAFPGLPAKVRALKKIFPGEYALSHFLVGPEIRVYVEAESPGRESTIRAEQTCDEFVNILEGAVDKLRGNAQRLDPQPLRSLGISKPLHALITAFASTEIEPFFRPELVRVDGEARAVPVIESAMLPTKITSHAANMLANHVIIGLVRGDEIRPHELILEGGVSVQLPKQPRFTWDEIHWVLETKHLLVGTLVRLQGTNKWIVHSDAKIASQAEIELGVEAEKA